MRARGLLPHGPRNLGQRAPVRVDAVMFGTRLSDIPEAAVSSQRMYLAFVGPTAWKLTEEFCVAADGVFTKRRFPRLGGTARRYPRSGFGKGVPTADRKVGTSPHFTDTPPFACSMRMDKEGRHSVAVRRCSNVSESSTSTPHVRRPAPTPLTPASALPFASSPSPSAGSSGGCASFQPPSSKPPLFLNNGHAGSSLEGLSLHPPSPKVPFFVSGSHSSPKPEIHVSDIALMSPPPSPYTSQESCAPSSRWGSESQDGRRASGSALVKASPWSQAGSLRSGLGIGHLFWGSRASASSSVCTADTAAPSLLRLCCHPVQQFSEPMPACQSIDQLQSACVLYLLDTRYEDSEMFPDLFRRVEEVERWVREFTRKLGVHSPPPLLNIVIQHGGEGQHRRSGSRRSGSTCSMPSLPDEDRTSALDAASAPELGQAVSPPDALRAATGPPPVSLSAPPAFADQDQLFVQRVRGMFPSQDTVPIHHRVNFDDADAFMRCVARVVASVLTSRLTEQDSGEIMFQPVFAAEGLTKTSCGCNVM